MTFVDIMIRVCLLAVTASAIIFVVAALLAWHERRMWDKQFDEMLKHRGDQVSEKILKMREENDDE